MVLPLCWDLVLIALSPPQEFSKVIHLGLFCFLWCWWTFLTTLAIFPVSSRNYGILMMGPLLVQEMPFPGCWKPWTRRDLNSVSMSIWVSVKFSGPQGTKHFQNLILGYTAGSELLGSPIVGSDYFFDDFFKARVNRILEAQSHLSDLDDPQIELHLLRSCLSVCKLNHLLRTTPPDRVLGQLQRFDEGLRHSLQAILWSFVSDLSWMQATLPIRMGGLVWEKHVEQLQWPSLEAVALHALSRGI